MAIACLGTFALFAMTTARPGGFTILTVPAARLGGRAIFTARVTRLGGLPFVTMTFASSGGLSYRRPGQLVAGRHRHIAPRELGGAYSASVTISSGDADTVQRRALSWVYHAHFL